MLTHSYVTSICSVSAQTSRGCLDARAYANHQAMLAGGKANQGTVRSCILTYAGRLRESSLLLHLLLETLHDVGIFYFLSSCFDMLCSIAAILLLSNAVYLPPAAGNLQLLVPNDTHMSPLCCHFIRIKTHLMVPLWTWVQLLPSSGACSPLQRCSRYPWSVQG